MTGTQEDLKQYLPAWQAAVKGGEIRGFWEWLPGFKNGKASQKVTFEGLGRATPKRLGYRNPKAGEFYLSGAVVTAYKAPNDLSSPYHVVEPGPDLVPLSFFQLREDTR
jgi:hypothetical protein